MFALIRFSDTFYVVVPPNFFYSAYMPPGYTPPPFINPPKIPYEFKKTSALTWDFTVDLRLRLKEVPFSGFSYMKQDTHDLGSNKQ